MYSLFKDASKWQRSDDHAMNVFIHVKYTNTVGLQQTQLTNDK